MNRPEIREICRSLQEFYPDPTARHEAHYFFAHRFFPEYFFDYPRAVVGSIYLEQDIDCAKYIQARWQMMEELVKKQAPEARPQLFRRVTDLSAWRETIGGHPALFVKMPGPEKSPEAYFVSAVLLVAASRPFVEWPDDASGRLFTLERLPDGQASGGVLCEWTRGKHLNLGTLVPATCAAFVHAVRQAVEDTLQGSKMRE